MYAVGQTFDNGKMVITKITETRITLRSNEHNVNHCLGHKRFAKCFGDRLDVMPVWEIDEDWVDPVLG